MKCREATRLMSDAQDRVLTAPERLALAAHLPLCSGCRNYRKQLAVMRHAAMVLREGGADEDAIGR
ncbi:zf-HC2 domain-containing protein [Chitinolyticbacter meiyuanensis]|uniref:zf-HC2 domain-containing protein n=1 Tax=Chitinolyticbacter meiyuanensis TaxID=682798 RepID=UPI0011E5C4F6|nr:zf-HC2 domain-containing protein [Chitinolyticbacter meiyuanensis]